MITNKDEAIQEVSKQEVDFDQLDKKFLRDKDVALAYMDTHSSNDVLVKQTPIDINGMVDDKDFILKLINYLNIGYNHDTLISLFKYSAYKIVEREITGDETDADKLKEEITQILTTYNDVLNLRKKQLEKKQSLLDEMNQYIEQLPIGKELVKKPKTERYKGCNIGFTAQF